MSKNIESRLKKIGEYYSNNGCLTKISSYLRLDEWYYSKVFMPLSVYLFFYLMNTEQYSFSRFITYFMSYFLFMFMFLAFSYVINDFSDIKVDKASGKNKVIYDIKPYAIILSLFAMFILGSTPILIITEFGISGIITIATIYFFGATYSIKFLRFKEKGLIGLIECAIAQKCLPLFILFFW